MPISFDSTVVECGRGELDEQGEFRLISRCRHWGLFRGIPALHAILASLPEEFPAAIAIVQLRSSEPGLLAEVLSFRSKRPVRDAVEGDRLAPSRSFLAQCEPLRCTRRSLFMLLLSG